MSPLSTPPQLDILIDLVCMDYCGVLLNRVRNLLWAAMDGVSD